MLAHQVAKAEAVAAFADAYGKPDTYTAGIVTWPGSGVTTLADVKGNSFAYSDPASTSGHLFPAYWLRKSGIDPDKGVKAIYAGSHTATFEAIRNHKVLAGELNSEQIEFGHACRANTRPATMSSCGARRPIPNDPIRCAANCRPASRRG